ncbi:MAG: ferredoxin oxidoreductase, partial [Dethiobacteria bacterium]
AHGIVGRAARQAVQELRREGRPVNFFRPITLRPFPEEPFREALQLSGGAVLVVESAEGQLGNLIRLAAAQEGLPDYRSYYRPGVGITAEEIKEATFR